VDLEHYHLLVSADGTLHRGEHPITDNISTADDDYAAHTRGCNTGAIGLAWCGMLDAEQSPLTFGPYPITQLAWNSGLIAAAELCRRYGIETSRRHLLMHCEVEPYLGVIQRGKWDVSVLQHDRGRWETVSPGEEMRRRVAMLLSEKP
jgi:hypothetical protein